MNKNKNNNNDTGIFQLENGYWGYRYVIKVNGQRKDGRRTIDEFIMNEKINAVAPTQIKIQHKTVKEVYNEYCE